MYTSTSSFSSNNDVKISRKSNDLGQNMVEISTINDDTCKRFKTRLSKSKLVEKSDDNLTIFSRIWSARRLISTSKSCPEMTWTNVRLSTSEMWHIESNLVDICTFADPGRFGLHLVDNATTIDVDIGRKPDNMGVGYGRTFDD